MLVSRLPAWLLASLLASACEGPPQSVPSDLGGDDDVAAMRGFSWVVDGQVAGMPRPGAGRPLDEDLAFLRGESVDLLVSLTETPVDADALARHGIAGLHIPVKDFHAPTIAQLDLYVRTVETWTAAGRQVGTHCGAGKGRTGTFLAALLVARGMEPDAAIAEVRRLRPGSIETAAQEQAVRDYAATLQPPRTR
jgi:atypical dual specificity phosphatase